MSTSGLRASIDLNSDLGEGAGTDAQLMPLISSANIARARAHGGRRRLHRRRSLQGHRGPSLHVLMKLLATMTLVLAPLFI